MTRNRVILVDDHPPIRVGIAAILERSGAYEVVAEAGCVERALEEFRCTSPDLVIVDISLPDGSGIDLVRVLKREAPLVDVLVLSMHARRTLADAAIQAGASGYLLKESTSEHLLRALDAIAAGESFLDGGLSRSTDGPGSTCEADVLTRLSGRELEVFRLLASGQNSKQVASLLGISPKTVDNHRLNIMEKLALESIVDLVRLAIRCGAVDP